MDSKPVYLSSIGTAAPDYRTSQAEIGQFMIDELGLDSQESHQLKVLYRASGIGHRHSVVPDFNRAPEEKFFSNGAADYIPSVSKRMEKYAEKALDLGKTALLSALNQTDVDQQEITHLITVSCTGMYAPGLDIDLIQTTNIASDVERTSINFMGCYAVFTALKTARHILQARPDSIVAIVSVELCSLHYKKKTDPDSLLSNALFGDGAAAAILTSGGRGQKELELVHQYSDLALDGKSEMKWDIHEQGFDMKLTTKVPEIIEDGIRNLTEKLLSSVSKQVDQIDFFAIHPGGKRILEVIEKELGIPSFENRWAREILRSYGNMSSPTILFVLQKIINELAEQDDEKSVLSFAFGPGLTLESMLMAVRINTPSP